MTIVKVVEMISKYGDIVDIHMKEAELEDILKDSNFLLFSVPAQVLRKVVPLIAPQLREDITIINIKTFWWKINVIK